MNRETVDSIHITRAYLLAPIAIAAVGAAAALAIAIETGGGIGGCTTTVAFRWFVPLVAAAVIGGVAVMLLDGHPSESVSVDTLQSGACAVCGSAIIDEWKLCPHCGALLECDVRMPLTGVVSSERKN
ncbi:MAG: zinc ribbon domain-containing protein [Coriobacteriia bacterium]|nr:zinc ribbon domain-containing protein [Coriobacteriia bacterium]